jgi:acyl carrier protein
MSDADTILEFLRDEAVDLPNGVTIDADTSLFKDQLLDSMSLTNLMTFLEDEFAIRIGAMDVVFENLDTVNHMLAFIARKREAALGG